MKDHKKVLAFALALSCAAGLASCSSESDGEHGYLMEIGRASCRERVCQYV